jgi:hypothetical protein
MTGVVVLAVLVAVLAALAAAVVAVLLRRRKLGERREKWQDQTTGPTGAMFNALFLAAFALCAVIGWQNYSSAKTHNDDERTALVKLYADVGPLPDADQLRAEIRDYTRRVIDVEWPLLPRGQSDPGAAHDLNQLTAQLLTVDPGAADEARNEATDRLNDVVDARQNRLADSGSEIPDGLLACVLVTAVVVLGHSTLVGLPHTPSSLIPLATEAGLIAVAVLILFLIRRPYHGTVDLDPEQFRLAMTAFSTLS